MENPRSEGPDSLTRIRIKLLLAVAVIAAGVAAAVIAIELLRTSLAA